MRICILLTVLLFFSLVSNAYAYIDYGTGSYVLQILAASAIGGVFFLKNAFLKIKNLFCKKKNEEGITDSIESEEN